MLSNPLAHSPVKDDFDCDDRNCTSARRVGQSREFMERHFNQRLKIPALAAQADVSVSHFFRLFRQDTGCAPLVYLNRLRIDRACELLMTTAWSVKLIAADLGYNDPLYFSRVFKSLIGMAPQAYRRSKKNGNEQNLSRSVKDNFDYFARS